MYLNKFYKFKFFTFFALVSITLTCYATIHVNLPSVTEHIYPNEKMERVGVTVTQDIRDKMQDISSVHQEFKTDNIYRTPHGDWLVVDEVVGKHELIKYAVAINKDGSIKQIEIMNYVESYGYEVAEPAWRQQFVGKTATSTIKLNKDIDNISGATLSCKHIADGVKRVMVMYDLVLKNKA